jgi:hypothetical protein
MQGVHNECAWRVPLRTQLNRVRAETVVCRLRDDRKELRPSCRTQLYPGEEGYGKLTAWKTCGYLFSPKRRLHLAS